MESNRDRPIDIADPFARQLMARYLERRDMDVNALRVALDSAEYEAIGVTGHKLFGSGATYGLDEISRLGERIEIAAVAQDADDIARLIGELEAYLKDLSVR